MVKFLTPGIYVNWHDDFDADAVMRQLEEELNRLGLVAWISKQSTSLSNEERLAAFIVNVNFFTNEDMNLYKLAGQIKESDRIYFYCMENNI